MTHYTVCCGYASHYHNTVTVEAGTLDEALEKAIAQAGDDPNWKSADYCSPTFVEALAEGEDADPWGDTAIPIPDRFTQNGEPPVVTLTGPRPRGPHRGQYRTRHRGRHLRARCRDHRRRLALHRRARDGVRPPGLRRRDRARRSPAPRQAGAARRRRGACSSCPGFKQQAPAHGQRTVKARHSDPARIVPHVRRRRGAGVRPPGPPCCPRHHGPGRARRLPMAGCR